MVDNIAKLAKARKEFETVLEKKIHELENGRQRCHILIMGLPKGDEGSNPVSFVKTWLPELLQVSFKGRAATWLSPAIPHLYSSHQGQKLPSPTHTRPSHCTRATGKCRHILMVFTVA